MAKTVFFAGWGHLWGRNMLRVDATPQAITTSGYSNQNRSQGCQKVKPWSRKTRPQNLCDGAHTKLKKQNKRSVSWAVHAVSVLPALTTGFRSVRPFVNEAKEPVMAWHCFVNEFLKLGCIFFKVHWKLPIFQWTLYQKTLIPEAFKWRRKACSLKDAESLHCKSQGRAEGSNSVNLEPGIACAVLQFHAGMFWTCGRIFWWSPHLN